MLRALTWDPAQEPAGGWGGVASLSPRRVLVALRLDTRSEKKILLQHFSSSEVSSSLSRFIRGVENKELAANLSAKAITNYGCCLRQHRRQVAGNAAKGAR